MMFAGVLILLVGLFVMASAVKNWDWYFNHRRACFIAMIFGRQGARIFYGIIGVVLVLFGVMLTLVGLM